MSTTSWFFDALRRIKGLNLVDVKNYLRRATPYLDLTMLESRLIGGVRNI